MADRLTVREVSCLRLLDGGRKNKEIAASLGIAERTVSNTLQSAYRKLGVTDRQEALAEFRRNWSETGHRLSMSVEAGSGSSDGVSGPVSRPPTFYRPTPPGLVNTSVIIAVFAVIGVLAVLALVTSRAFHGLG